jgi:hypothetical protein
MYTRYSGKVVTLGRFDYIVNLIPPEFTLVANILNDETEEALIKLINSNDRIKLTETMKCIASEFQPELNYKLNDFSWNKLKPGEGMMPEKEDSKYYNPCVIVINMGSDIELILLEQATRKQVPIILPRKSMFLLNDVKWKFQRAIPKKFEDKLSNGEVIKREERYSLVFKSRK